MLHVNEILRSVNENGRTSMLPIACVLSTSIFLHAPILSRKRLLSVVMDETRLSYRSRVGDHALSLSSSEPSMRAMLQFDRILVEAAVSSQHRRRNVVSMAELT